MRLGRGILGGRGVVLWRRWLLVRHCQSGRDHEGQKKDLEKNQNKNLHRVDHKRVSKIDSYLARHFESNEERC